MAELAKPVISDLKIQKIKPELLSPFNDPKYKARIEAILPDVDRETISFRIKNANTAIANGLRRTINGELPVKYMTTEISNIRTNEDFIKLGELVDRINFIPLNQNASDTLEFKLSVKNNTEDYKIVYSSDLVAEDRKKYFTGKFRLAELRPGKYLEISKVIVRENFGFKYSACCLTNDSKYEITDYLYVNFVNEKANFIPGRVKESDLLALFKKSGIKYDKDDLFQKRILIIPNRNYQDLMGPKELKRVKNYDIVVENPEAWKIEPGSDDKFIKKYQTTEYRARDFYLAFSTYGNISSSAMLIWACDNLISRLSKIQKDLSELQKNNEAPDLMVSIFRDNLKTVVVIENEDHTISQLLKQTIYELDSGIGLVNDPNEHPLIRKIILNIIHPNPIKILTDAIEICIGHFESLKKNFKS